jgi:DNA recombination protein RmuC
LVGTFADLSRQALAENNEQFMALADARLQAARAAADGDLARLLVPIRDSLTRHEQSVRRLELDRQDAYAQLTEQVRGLATSQDQLQRETRNLVTALRSPQTRGRWGEMQLRRVVEMAGMLAHCDFTEQVTVHGEEGRLRPDMVVHLAGGAQVVVDAKVAMEAYLRAVDADDEASRRTAMEQHARQLRTHVDQLAKKEYWSQFDPSPELVVAFVPGDPLLAAAFEHDPGLIEHAMASRVLLCTPTTLIALLRAVAFGWRQEDMAANAREVQQLGTELYERLRVMGTHMAKLQRHISGTVEAYNEAVGSFESRVLVTARRFPDLGVTVTGKEIGELAPLASVPRLVRALELGLDDGADEAEGTDRATPTTDDGGPAALPGPDAVLHRLTGA